MSDRGYRRPPAKLRPTAGRIWTDARTLWPRSTVEALARGYVENDILTYASAIAFQGFFALIPLACSRSVTATSNR